MVAVDETKEHIQAGDIFQLVLSQRFERRTQADPFEIYRCRPPGASARNAHCRRFVAVLLHWQPSWSPLHLTGRRRVSHLCAVWLRTLSGYGV